VMRTIVRTMLTFTTNLGYFSAFNVASIGFSSHLFLVLELRILMHLCERKDVRTKFSVQIFYMQFIAANDANMLIQSVHV
jgi:hypothetical protein